MFVKLSQWIWDHFDGTLQGFAPVLAVAAMAAFFGMTHDESLHIFFDHRCAIGAEGVAQVRGCGVPMAIKRFTRIADAHDIAQPPRQLRRNRTGTPAISVGSHRGEQRSRW